MTDADLELDLIARFRKSEMWSWFETYLVNRREALFHNDVTNNFELWKKEGAIREINRLLKAPDLVVQFIQSKQPKSTPNGPSEPDNFTLGSFGEGTDDF